MGKRCLLNRDDPFGVFHARNDFMEFVTGDLYSSLVADAGTSLTVNDAAGGTVTLGTAATDNNEAYVFTTKEIFKIVENKPAEFIARIQFAEANTDDANVGAGFMDAVGANALVDNGAGPKASYSGAVIFKVDGGTKWKCQTSNGAAQVTTESKHTAGGSGFHTLRILVEPIDSVNAEVSFWIDTAGGDDWVQMRDANEKLIKHTLALASLTEMNAFAGVKAGGATAESLVIDLIDPAQKR
jgi:hypothetical protein